MPKPAVLQNADARYQSDTQCLTGVAENSIFQNSETYLPFNSPTTAGPCFPTNR